MNEAFGARRQREWKRQGSHGFDGRRNAFHREGAVVNRGDGRRHWRLLRIRRRSPWRQRAGWFPQPSSGRRRNNSSRSRRLASLTASAIDRQCASASSRATIPSRRPSESAKPPLVVASASKPIPARMRALPTSHGFGMMNAPGSADSARAPNAAPVRAAPEIYSAF